MHPIDIKNTLDSMVIQVDTREQDTPKLRKRLEAMGNYTRGRGRFSREFQRMADSGGKLHIIVENGSWEKVLDGEYRSLLSPAALSASLLAWEARYGAQLHFCKPATTGILITKILYYEMKEILERGELDEHSG